MCDSWVVQTESDLAGAGTVGEFEGNICFQSFQLSLYWLQLQTLIVVAQKFAMFLCADIPQGA